MIDLGHSGHLRASSGAAGREGAGRKGSQVHWMAIYLLGGRGRGWHIFKKGLAYIEKGGWRGLNVVC